VKDALKALRKAEEAAKDAETELTGLLTAFGYARDSEC
jgi:hypothetical protein